MCECDFEHGWALGGEDGPCSTEFWVTRVGGMVERKGSGNREEGTALRGERFDCKG